MTGPFSRRNLGLAFFSLNSHLLLMNLSSHSHGIFMCPWYSETHYQPVNGTRR